MYSYGESLVYFFCQRNLQFFAAPYYMIKNFFNIFVMYAFGVYCPKVCHFPRVPDDAKYAGFFKNIRIVHVPRVMSP